MSTSWGPSALLLQTGSTGRDHTPFMLLKPERRAPAVRDTRLPFLPGTGGFHREPTGGQGKATGKLKPLGQQSKEGYQLLSVLCRLNKGEHFTRSKH